MAITVNHSTPADGSFSASGATAWNANHTLVGLGTMAEQNANNVNITGGTISGVTGIGTVTSVTGTSPVISSGGNTPAISMPAATTSINGYLTSTDWTTFNGKQDLLISGTNIKTINGSSLLGSGNLTISASAGGADTQIQYNNSGAFAGNANFTYTGNDVNVPFGPSNSATPISRVALAISLMS
jgi:hypothetical protein